MASFVFIINFFIQFTMRYMKRILMNAFESKAFFPRLEPLTIMCLSIHQPSIAISLNTMEAFVIRSLASHSGERHPQSSPNFPSNFFLESLFLYLSSEKGSSDKRALSLSLHYSAPLASKQTFPRKGQTLLLLYVERKHLVGSKKKS